jgi:hypothetical protein
MTTLPRPPRTPMHELHMLIAHGYASKNAQVRKAAATVDTWASKLPAYLNIVWQRADEECPYGKPTPAVTK